MKESTKGQGEPRGLVIVYLILSLCPLIPKPITDETSNYCSNRYIDLAGWTNKKNEIGRFRTHSRDLGVIPLAK